MDWELQTSGEKASVFRSMREIMLEPSTRPRQWNGNLFVTISLTYQTKYVGTFRHRNLDQIDKLAVHVLVFEFLPAFLGAQYCHWIPTWEIDGSICRFAYTEDSNRLALSCVIWREPLMHQWFVILFKWWMSLKGHNTLLYIYNSFCSKIMNRYSLYTSLNYAFQFLSGSRSLRLRTGLGSSVTC